MLTSSSSFGSSYSDNGHPRASKYAGTSAVGSGYWVGRVGRINEVPAKTFWHNRKGAIVMVQVRLLFNCESCCRAELTSSRPFLPKYLVWTEHLANYLGTKFPHLNYAYGGATTNNSIHPSTSPDTSQQMAMYLQDGYTPGVKPLVALFTTTNDITATFKDYVTSGSGIYQDSAGAMNVITQSAQSLIRELATLIPSNASDVAPDYLILPILPVELTPKVKGVAAQANVTTDMARDITRRYNSVLLNGARSLAKQLDTRGSVFTYDVPRYVNVNPSYSRRAHGDLRCTLSQLVVCHGGQTVQLWTEEHRYTIHAG